MGLVLFRVRSHLFVFGAIAALVVLLTAALALFTIGATRSTDPQAKAAAAVKPGVGETTQPEPPAARSAPADTCASCGAVEAIRAVEVKADATGAGAESGPDLDKTASKRIVYRVTVRMDDGSYRTLSQATPPAVTVGEKVQLVDGAVVARR